MHGILSLWGLAQNDASSFAAVQKHFVTVFAGSASCEELSQSGQIDQLRRLIGMEENVPSDLNWFLGKPHQSRRKPWIALVWQDGRMVGSVYLSEKLVFGLPTGFLRLSDALGECGVVAAEEDRAWVLRSALEAICARRGVRGIRVQLECKDLLSSIDGYELKYRRRAGHWRLSLEGGVDATLGRMGTRTRRNLRHYAKRMKALGVRFVPEMNQTQSCEAVGQLAATRNSLTHLGMAAERERWMQNLAHGYCAGLCLPSGEWISFATGWRKDGITYLDWQMNHGEHPKWSLATAMRMFMLEHEVKNGVREIRFVGSLSGSLASYTEPEVCMDWSYMNRKSWCWRVVEWGIRNLLPQTHPMRATLAAGIPALVPEHGGIEGLEAGLV